VSGSSWLLYNDPYALTLYTLNSLNSSFSIILSFTLFDPSLNTRLASKSSVLKMPFE